MLQASVPLPDVLQIHPHLVHVELEVLVQQGSWLLADGQWLAPVVRPQFEGQARGHHVRREHRGDQLPVLGGSTDTHAQA